MWERSVQNSSRNQQAYNRKPLTYQYIEIIIFCGHWCTCYLIIQHPPCTTHINHRSVTYWTSIPPKTKKWLTRSRGEKKLALQKHEAKQLKQLLFIKATLHVPPIALASDIVTSVTQKIILIMQVVDYQVI